ncbi:hypothetical protein D9613_011811 [Agrocybe pediades]|uniref:Uncharacterized protein n=1 Tax=Agrocybe pediades TaxID=84607 RepID=A0A8H4QKD0_9AGAR|nr:hypothetical protein D9613_011811 [Agrocybe pediades]
MIGVYITYLVAVHHAFSVTTTMSTGKTDLVHRFTHPEIEIRPLLGRLVRADSPDSDPTKWCEPAPGRTVDLIEVGGRIERSMAPAEFARYCGALHSSRHSKKSRIIFVNDPSGGAAIDTNYGVVQHPPALDATALWLHRTFGTSLIVFDHLHPTTGSEQLNIGQGSFLRYSDDGQIASKLESFYQFGYDLTSLATLVWFSYDLRERSSTYVIFNGSPDAKQNIIACADSGAAHLLLRPLSVDSFLADDCMFKLGAGVNSLRFSLLEYERNFALAKNERSMEGLHSLSQHLHVTKENLADLSGRLKFLMEIHRKYLDAVRSEARPSPQSIQSIRESIELLESRAEHMQRWVTNYIERTGIRIALLFNLTAQGDSQTNLDIARLTTKISVATQKDSSSMITMAAVTMFFLPGSFVSGFFGMIFFSEADAQGRQVLTVSPQWWLFPVITIPLTVLVFVIWMIWQRRRKVPEIASELRHDSALGPQEVGVTNYWNNAEKHAQGPDVYGQIRTRSPIRSLEVRSVY